MARGRKLESGEPEKPGMEQPSQTWGCGGGGGDQRSLQSGKWGESLPSHPQFSFAFQVSELIIVFIP